MKQLAAKEDAQQSNTNNRQMRIQNTKCYSPKRRACIQDQAHERQINLIDSSYTPGSAERRNKNQRYLVTELVIYNLLCEQFREENVYRNQERLLGVVY